MATALADIFLDATSPYLRLVFEHLWPDLSALAGVSVATRAGGTSIAEETMAASLGPAASDMLSAPWLVVQAAFAKPIIFLAGGHDHERQLVCCKWSELNRGRNSGWQELHCSNMPVERYQEHTAAFCNGILYVTNDCDHAGFHQYNLIRNEWKPCAQPQPKPGYSTLYGGALAAHEGRLYYSGGTQWKPGGAKSRYGGEVFIYDVAGDTWQEVHTQTHAPRSHHALVSFEGSLWVAGGSRCVGAHAMPFLERCADGKWQAETEAFPFPWMENDPYHITRTRLVIVGDTLLAHFDDAARLARYDRATRCWIVLSEPRSDEEGDEISTTFGWPGFDEDEDEDEQPGFDGDVVACGDQIAIFWEGSLQLVTYQNGIASTQYVRNQRRKRLELVKELGSLVPICSAAATSPAVSVRR